MRATWIAVSTVLAASAPVWGPARPEGLIEGIYAACAGAPSNADYGTCIGGLVDDGAGGLEGLVCGAETCLVPLECGEPYGRICRGDGYLVERTPTGTGADVIITEPNGDRSVYNACGTCMEYDYVAGSLAGAALAWLGETRLLLEFPR